MKYLISSAIGPMAWVNALMGGPLIPLSVLELTNSSNVILHGKVISKKMARDEDGRVYTTVRMQVEDLWKGKITGEFFEIEHGGGILGNRKVSSPYQVRYNIHDEVVVFCRLNSRGKGVTIGLIQGKFEVMGTESSGHYVRNRFHGGPPPSAKPDRTRHRMPHQIPLPMASLKAQVQGGAR